MTKGGEGGQISLAFREGNPGPEVWLGVDILQKQAPVQGQ